MLVMDSGLGGLSVVRALRAARPGMVLAYLADTAGFPYGGRDAEDITARAGALLREMERQGVHGPRVLACNTLSTLCLQTLRETFSAEFVGTVPAIKVAAHCASKRFTLLATPNTAHSSYSEQLIAEFAQGCVVDRYGAPNLARVAEALLLGDAVDDAVIAAEVAPAFYDDARGRTDAVVLGCTHYPLMLDRLKAAAPWKVQWIDSGEAIARRALRIQEVPEAGPSIAYVTRVEDVARYRAVFMREGFDEVRALIT